MGEGRGDADISIDGKQVFSLRPGQELSVRFSSLRFENRNILYRASVRRWKVAGGMILNKLCAGIKTLRMDHPGINKNASGTI